MTSRPNSFACPLCCVFAHLNREFKYLHCLFQPMVYVIRLHRIISVVLNTINSSKLIFWRNRDLQNNKNLLKTWKLWKFISVNPVGRFKKFLTFCDPEVIGFKPVSSDLSDSRIAVWVTVIMSDRQSFEPVFNINILT